MALHERKISEGSIDFTEFKVGDIRASRLGNLVANDDHAITIPPPGRLTLSPEARRTLLSTGLLALEGTGDPAWPDLEDALLEILMPVRYITGVAQPDTDLCTVCRTNPRRAGHSDCSTCDALSR